MVHGGVGILDQCPGVRRIAREQTDADGRGQRYFLLREHEGPRQRQLHAARHDLRAVGRGDAGQRQREFVAAGARHPIVVVG